MSFVPSSYLDLPASGGCQCGAVRYEITEAPVDANYCHCHCASAPPAAPSPSSPP
ncbi:MAG: hypothetical protein R3F14_10330 [Polyangiaceae bacterium]